MSLFSGKRGREGAMWAAGQLQLGKDEANGALDTGYGTAKAELGKAGDLYANLAASYGGGSKLYQDALGVNGANGADKARSVFTASPGYGFALDQGMQALQRQRAVNGTLASGNTDTDAMTFANGLASQEWNGWLDRLGGLDKNRLAATAGEAGTFADTGRLGFQTGAAKAGVASDTAQGIAQAGMQGFQAGDRAEENKFGAIMGGANLAARLIGSLSGSPNAMGNIGSNLQSLGSGLSSAFSIFG